MKKNLLAKLLKPMWWYDHMEEPRKMIVMLIIIAPLFLLTVILQYPINLIPLGTLYIILMYRIVYLYIMKEIKNIFKGD